MAMATQRLHSLTTAAVMTTTSARARARLRRSNKTSVLNRGPVQHTSASGQPVQSAASTATAETTATQTAVTPPEAAVVVMMTRGQLRLVIVGQTSRVTCQGLSPSSSASLKQRWRRCVAASSQTWRTWRRRRRQRWRR